MKAHHQNELYSSIRYGDISFDRVDFFAAWKSIHEHTMTPRNIRGGWRKTGLFPYNPQVVFENMSVFDSDSQAQHVSSTSASTSVSAPPSTPPLRPFQQPPTSQTRRAHETYLQTRIDDHIDSLCPLTPSYSTSLRAFHEYTARKATEVKLIEDHDLQRQENNRMKAKLKAGSSRYVQKSGAIRFGDARVQVQERDTEEWLREGEKDVVNMATQRRLRAEAIEAEKVARTLNKERIRQQKAESQATDREQQALRKEATKVAVQELGRAITRAGLRSRVNLLGKELWKPLEVHVKHKGEIWEASRPIQETIDIYIKWRVEYTKVLLGLKADDDKLQVLQKERSLRRTRALSAILRYGNQEAADRFHRDWCYNF